MMITVRVERTNKEQTLPISNPFVLKSLNGFSIGANNTAILDLGLNLYLPENTVISPEKIHPILHPISVYSEKNHLFAVIANYTAQPYAVLQNEEIVNVFLITLQSPPYRFLEIIDGKIIRYGDAQGAGEKNGV